MLITSLENNKVKDLIKLQMKKYRDLTNSYIVEGEHLVLEAYKSNRIKEVFLLENENIDIDVPYTFITKDIMKKITTLDTPPSIIALCEKNNNNEIIGNKVLLLDEIQDPGNLGTIIRSSVAFGIETIILSENTVDLYNPKVLRSSQGMNNHINIISMNAKEAIEIMKKEGFVIYGTNVEKGIDVRELDNKSKEKIMNCYKEYIEINKLNERIYEEPVWT